MRDMERLTRRNKTALYQNYMKACIFNIGTYHHYTEPQNLLVKLWKEDCSFGDLGVIENQSGKHHGQAALDVYRKKGLTRSGNTGYMWINDGANETGTGILPQTDINVKLLLDIHERETLESVTIVGHSRGAVLALRIAAKLFEVQPDVPCHLLLYDPVKRMAEGTDRITV